MAVRAISLFFALTGAAATIWTALDAATNDDEPIWFSLALLATVPVLIGAGLAAPAFFKARSQAERTLVIAEPVPAACLGAAWFIGCLALAAALGGGWWYLVGAVFGVVCALQAIASMRHIRRLMEAQLGPDPPPPPRADGDFSKGEIASAIIRSVFAVGVLIVVVTAFVYVALGSTAAIVVCLLFVVLVVVLYLSTLARIRARKRRGSTTPGDGAE